MLHIDVEVFSVRRAEVLVYAPSAIRACLKPPFEDRHAVLNDGWTGECAENRMGPHGVPRNASFTTTGGAVNEIVSVDDVVIHAESATDHGLTAAGRRI